MAPNPNLQRLQQAGVSIWLDTLSRELLQTGEFAELIDNYGVTGATSNPTIFAKAITDSDRYDGQLRELVAGGERDTRKLFFSLALDDIRAAVRLLSPAYEHSQGDDGFISFECTPIWPTTRGARGRGPPRRGVRAREEAKRARYPRCEGGPAARAASAPSSLQPAHDLIQVLPGCLATRRVRPPPDRAREHHRMLTWPGGLPGGARRLGGRGHPLEN